MCCDGPQAAVTARSLSASAPKPNHHFNCPSSIQLSYNPHYLTPASFPAALRDAPTSLTSQTKKTRLLIQFKTNCATLSTSFGQPGDKRTLHRRGHWFPTELGLLWNHQLPVTAQTSAQNSDSMSKPVCYELQASQQLSLLRFYAISSPPSVPLEERGNRQLQCPLLRGNCTIWTVKPQNIRSCFDNFRFRYWPFPSAPRLLVTQTLSSRPTLEMRPGPPWAASRDIPSSTGC